MQPIDVFIDTSAMPRNLTRPGHAWDQIIELCEAKLLQIHVSDVALREWRSQRTKDFLDTIKEMHSHLRHAIRQPLTKKLTSRKLISQLLDKRDATTAEATREADKSCDEFIKKVGINEMPIHDSDGAAVFKAYFTGESPFREPKSRDDLPDAFILCAARRFAIDQFNRTHLAICSDRRLRRAIAKIPDAEPFETVMDFLQSAPIQEAMRHLELSRLWTADKANEAIAFLSKQRKYLSRLIHDFAYDTLQGQSFTESSIPVDNNEAIISAFGELEDLQVEWDKVEQYGPGWLLVPFRFESDTELEFAVYRADTFSVPDWIHVTIGDFEKDHYFEANAERRLGVTGYLSFRLTKDEITAKKLRLPASVEVEDHEVELVDKDEYEDAY